MKKFIIPIAAAGFMMLAASCGDNKSETSSSDTTVTMDHNMPAAPTDNNNMQAQNQNQNQNQDADFAMKAADGGMSEVMNGQLAEKNAAAKDVKDFGRMMVTDHTKANDELKALASKKNITLPATVSAEHQQMHDDLAKKTGKDFDKAYMDMMVDDHQKTIDLFQNEANNGTDADMKAWAAKTLPILQQHLDKAKKIRDGLK